MKLPVTIARAVVARAAGRCEYCRMHQSLQGATFHVEHITPRSRSGNSRLENLALACPACNLHKADRIEAQDPQGLELIALFNPRSDEWLVHFRWEQFQVVALTSTGRATIAALKLNDPIRQRIRRAEAFFGLFPPED